MVVSWGTPRRGELVEGGAVGFNGSIERVLDLALARVEGCMQGASVLTIAVCTRQRLLYKQSWWAVV